MKIMIMYESRLELIRVHSMLFAIGPLSINNNLSMIAQSPCDKIIIIINVAAYTRYTLVIVVDFYRFSGSGNGHSDVEKAVDSYVSKYNKLSDAGQTLLIVKM